MRIRLGQSLENAVELGRFQNLSPQTALIVVGIPVAGAVAGLAIFAVVLKSSESEHRADMIRAAGDALIRRR